MGGDEKGDFAWFYDQSMQEERSVRRKKEQWLPAGTVGEQNPVYFMLASSFLCSQGCH